MPSEMKYKVICNQCHKPFIAETDKPGKAKYRCPNCGHVMTCLLGNEAVTPPVNRTAGNGAAANNAAKPTARQRAAATGKTLYNAAQRSSDAIGKFRKSNDNADLWLFFGFSLLFVVIVIAGLIVGAELAKLIATGKSWLFRLYLDIIHSF